MKDKTHLILVRKYNQDAKRKKWDKRKLSIEIQWITVGTEGISNFVLRDSGQPDCRIGLNLWGGNEESVVTRVHGVEAPEGEPEAAVRIETECDVSWRV